MKTAINNTKYGINQNEIKAYGWFASFLSQNNINIERKVKKRGKKPRLEEDI